MCTRYYIDDNSKELAQIVELAKASALTGRFQEKGAPLMTRGEIRPTNVAPVIATARSGDRKVFPMKWGYRMETAPGAKPSLLLNARSETAGQKLMFQESWIKHRCIIPASFYYEWRHEKDASGKNRGPGVKYSIQPAGAEVTWLAGLYRMEDGLPHFVVLTREPSPDVAFIHDRMPLILPEDLINYWIRPNENADALLTHALDEMVPTPEYEQMEL